MKEPDWAECDEKELWTYVGWHLAKRGIQSVLVGGAVVSIYTDGLYKSGDIDLLTYEDSIAQLDQAMAEIGFKKKDMHYRNPKCMQFYIQSVSGPLGIGDDLQIKPQTITVEGQKLMLLTPTDCIRDRLSAFIYDQVRSLFDQAVLVAKHHPFEDKKIKKWLKDEGREDLFNEFIASVNRP